MQQRLYAAVLHFGVRQLSTGFSLAGSCLPQKSYSRDM